MSGMLKKLLAHGAIVISVMYIVFFCIDLVNPAMGFIDNGITKTLLLILGLIAIINAIQVIAYERKKLRLLMRRRSQTVNKQGSNDRSSYNRPANKQSGYGGSGYKRSNYSQSNYKRENYR